jgi:adenylate kinase family enzyme
LERGIVVGTSGCGKTTFARRLAQTLALQHIELDRLFWLPGWQPRDVTEFCGRVEQCLSVPRWVVDGNYGMLRDVTWPRATHAVWLNYPFALVLARVTRRTLARIAAQREVFPGCRETLRNSFLSPKSVIWWSITTYRPRRQRYAAMRREQAFPQLTWVELRSPLEARAFWLSLEAIA